MSRIGKKFIPLPAGVNVNMEATRIIVTGPHGQVTVPLAEHAHVSETKEPRQLEVSVDDATHVKQSALWGLTRQLLNNAVTGVQTPFSKALEFVGVGFKVALEGKDTLVMDVGFSHKVRFSVPEGISVTVEKQIVTLRGVDRQLVGEIAAQIRRVKPPEPYKGKGIKYTDEVIRRKAGKAAKTGA